MGDGPGAALKKLKAVAAALAGVGSGKSAITEETIAEAKAMGASDDALAKMRAQCESGNDIVEVEPENVDAVRLFFALQTQWRQTPLSNGKITMLVRTGLDYGVLPVTCTALCITFDEDALAKLQLLEGETLRILGEHRERLFA